MTKSAYSYKQSQTLAGKYIHKVISDLTKNVELYLIWLPVCHKIIVEGKHVLEVLPFLMLPDWVEHEIVNIIIQGVS